MKEESYVDGLRRIIPCACDVTKKWQRDGLVFSGTFNEQYARRVIFDKSTGREKNLVSGIRSVLFCAPWIAQRRMLIVPDVFNEWHSRKATSDG